MWNDLPIITVFFLYSFLEVFWTNASLIFNPVLIHLRICNWNPILMWYDSNSFVHVHLIYKKHNTSSNYMFYCLVRHFISSAYFIKEVYPHYILAIIFSGKQPILNCNCMPFSLTKTEHYFTYKLDNFFSIILVKFICASILNFLNTHKLILHFTLYIQKLKLDWIIKMRAVITCW